MTRRPGGVTAMAIALAVVALVTAEQVVAPAERVFGLDVPAWWTVLMALEAILSAALAILLWRMRASARGVYIAWGVLVVFMGAWYQHVVGPSALAFAQELGFDAPASLPLSWELASNALNALLVWAGYVYIARQLPRTDFIRAGAPT